MRLELLGSLVVACASILSVEAASRGRLGAGLAGLAITNALGVTGLLNWAVRCFAETEAMMNSVERVMQLIERVPSEAPAILGPAAGEDGTAEAPPPSTPQHQLHDPLASSLHQVGWGRGEDQLKRRMDFLSGIVQRHPELNHDPPVRIPRDHREPSP